MKLPEITYSQAQAAQSISPAQAAAPHLAKAKMIGQLSQTGLEMLDRKRKSDTARIAALYVDSVTTDERRLAESEELSRDELIEIYGMSDADSGIEWTDADGNEKQVFKRYEVESVVKERMLEDRLVEFSRSIPNSEYKTLWMRDTREANARVVLASIKDTAKQEKAYEYKSAVASLEALNTSPEAQLEFAKSSPALDDRPEVRQKYVARAKAALYDTKVNNIINNGTDAEIQRQVDKMKDPEKRAKLPVTEKQIRIMQSRAQSELDKRQRARDLAEGNALKLSKEQEAERNKLAKEAMSDYSVAKGLGMNVSEEQELKVKGLVSGTDYQEDFELLNDVEEFAVLSRLERDAELSSLSDGTLDEVYRFKAYAKSSAMLKEAAQADGYLLGVSQGLIDFEPVDIYDNESVDNRIEQANYLSGHYGEPVSPFSRAEIKAYSSILSNMTVDEQVRMADAFKSIPEVWEQFAKSGQEVFAWVGAAGTPELSSTALAGQKKIDSGDVVSPSKKEYLLASNEYLGNVYGTLNKSAVMATALAVYAEIAPVGDEGDFDTAAWKAALEMATGGVGEINGNKVVIPRGTSADIMQDYVDLFSADNVREFGGVPGMTDEEAAEKIRDGVWVSEGEGKYTVITGAGLSLMQGAEPFFITYNRNTALDTAATEFSLNRKRTQLKLTGSDMPSPEHFRR